MAIFTILSLVILFSTGTHVWAEIGLSEIFATLAYIFTMRVVIYDILSMAIIPTLSTYIQKKSIHCVAIFTMLYDNYYPPHGEFKLISIGKFARRT